MQPGYTDLAEHNNNNNKERSSFIPGYYRKFIPHYATIATPPTDLTRKSRPNKVVWTPDCAESFQKLKNAPCSAPIPNFDQKFILQTDASDRG